MRGIVVGFDPKGQTFFSITPIPSGGSTVRNMVYSAAAREIWFGTDSNNFARVP